MVDVSGPGAPGGSRRCGHTRIIFTGERRNAELAARKQNQEQRWHRNNRKHTEKKTKNKQLTNTDTHKKAPHRHITPPNTQQIKRQTQQLGKRIGARLRSSPRVKHNYVQSNRPDGG